MTKSGSTLAYELARSALVMAGYDQPRLSTNAVLDRKKINFVNHIGPEQVAALEAETAEIGHPIALKTHTRPDDGVVRLLQEGRATAHAIYRDPRDMALSMLDHAANARAKGKPNFTEFHTVEDTIDNIRHQTNTLLSWLSLPNVRPLYYVDVAFDMENTATLLMEELGVDAPVDDVIFMATQQRFTQRNKGVKARHETELTPEMSARFLDIFAPFYEKLVENRKALPRDGRPVLAADTPLCHWES